jgi:sugar lactone lactonase YvrE
VRASFTAALAIVIAAALGGARPAAADEPCNPVDRLNFVCGPLNSEDLVQVPGTTWIIASGMDGGAAGQRGSLHWIDSVDKTWAILFPDGNPQMRWDKATYGDCPGPPDLSTFSAHGINLRPGAGGTDTLYVVNHGGRESIEVFALDMRGSAPAVIWTGCAVMPPHTWPNAVAPLPDGGFVVTDMFDPQDPKVSAELAAGADTGAVYEWHPHKGFALLPGSRMSGNNGIEVSPDGKWVYVAAWGGKAVVRLARDGGAAPRRDVLPAGFLVDNLRRAPDGTLVVAGQNVPASDVFACFRSPAPRCTQPWRLARWDVKAMKLQPLASQPGNPEFGDATVGLQIGSDMFVGTFRGDRVAYFSLK